jgi:hypothetical protein
MSFPKRLSASNQTFKYVIILGGDFLFKSQQAHNTLQGMQFCVASIGIDIQSAS